MAEGIEVTSYNEKVRDFWYPNWTLNAARNYEFIRAEYEKKFDQIDLAACPRANNIPAIILGSGPSLERALPLLRFWKYPIFATMSHMKILDALKRPAEFVMALDTTTRAVEQLGNDIEYPFTTMITHPSMCLEVLKKWVWKRFYFRMYEPDSAFLETLYTTLFPFIHSRIMNSGCVVNNQIIVSTGLGFSPLFLIGVDFSYPTIREIIKPSELFERVMPRQMPNETEEMYQRRKSSDPEWQKFLVEYKENPDVVYRHMNMRDKDVPKAIRRFRDYDEIGPHVYEPKEWDVTDLDNDPTLIPSDSGPFTTPVNLFYKHTLLTNWKLMGNQMVDCSYGMMRDSGIPRMNFDDVLKTQGEGIASKPGDPLWTDREEINKRVDEYMIPRGSFAKYGKNGEILGVEFVHGLERQRQEAQGKAAALTNVMDKWTHKDGKWSRKMEPEDEPWKVQKPKIVKP